MTRVRKRSEGVRIANPARDGDGERRGREGGERRGGVGSFARTSHR